MVYMTAKCSDAYAVSPSPTPCAYKQKLSATHPLEYISERGQPRLIFLAVYLQRCHEMLQEKLQSENREKSSSSSITSVSSNILRGEKGGLSRYDLHTPLL